jgi:hypothetical protein
MFLELSKRCPTSPMPPALMGDVISYGPNRVPGVKSMACRTIVPYGCVRNMDCGRTTGNPEVIPGQKSRCGKLEVPLAIATNCRWITAYPELADLSKPIQPSRSWKTKSSSGLAFYYCGHVAAGSRFTIGCAPVVGTCGRRYGRLAVLWHE